MASQRRNFLHSGVLPHNNLVERVPMGGHEFIVGLRENQVAHLGACVYRRDWLKSHGVPEPDVLVSGTATCS